MRGIVLKLGWRLHFHIVISSFHTTVVMKRSRRAVWAWTRTKETVPHILDRVSSETTRSTQDPRAGASAFVERAVADGFERDPRSLKQSSTDPGLLKRWGADAIRVLTAHRRSARPPAPAHTLPPSRHRPPILSFAPRAAPVMQSSFHAGGGQHYRLRRRSSTWAGTTECSILAPAFDRLSKSGPLPWHCSQHLRSPQFDIRVSRDRRNMKRYRFHGLLHPFDQVNFRLAEEIARIWTPMARSSQPHIGGFHLHATGKSSAAVNLRHSRPQACR